jgi:hypothetical protein
MLNAPAARYSTSAAAETTTSSGVVTPYLSLSARNLHLSKPNGLSPDQPQLCPICDATCTAPCPDCSQSFCIRHIYSCVECGAELCSNCLDSHHADGHWSDSDTAAELAHVQYMAAKSVPGHPDHKLSGVSAVVPAIARSAASSALTSFVSWLAQLLRPPAFVQPEACL